MRKINAQQSQDAIQSKHKIIEKIVSGQAELSKKKKKKRAEGKRRVEA